MPLAFEKLLIYQKALDFSDRVCELSGTFPRGSVQECVPLLELVRRRGFLPDAEHNALKSNLEEISRMLSGLINGLDKQEGL